MLLRTILIGALMAGTITGVLFTVIQQFQVTPLILEAETYESSDTDHAHAQEAHSTSSASVDENTQRMLFSLLANVLAGIGFALIAASAITFSDQKGWRKGLLWGIAGFMVFFAAPSLGLHPKLPGATGAPLLHQQLWWVSTAAATAAGMALLVFAHRLPFKGMGLLLLVAPHLVGAPLPEQAFSSAPESLVQEFVIASTLANAAFWLILGALSGYFLHKLTDDAFLN